MINYKKQIESLLTELKNSKLLNSINKIHIYYDEPQLNQFNAHLNFPKKFTNGFPPPNAITATGLSYTNKYLALLKCLSESIERISLFCYQKKSILIAKKGELKADYVNPKLFKPNYPNEKIGWVKGFNLIDKCESFLPAQLIYINYLLGSNEQIIIDPISTGAAGGFNHKQVLLNGIYEVIERDAFMTVYLTKSRVFKINLNTVTNPIIQDLVEYYHRYNLKVFVFDLTHDLSIPSYLTILVDQTKIGPALSLGMKTNLNSDNALLGSLEEAFLSRMWIRGEIKERKQKKIILPHFIKTPIDRALFWSFNKMINKLTFFQSLQEKPYDGIAKRLSIENEFKYVLQIVKKKKLALHFANITLDRFKRLNHFIYKVVLPDLQPLYLNETNQRLNTQRLNTVLRYFNKKKLFINNIPHPFL